MTLGGPGIDGWRTSSRCESHNCVEVAIGGDRAGVRSTALPHTQLSFSAPAWRRFIQAVRTADFVTTAQ